MVTASEHSPAQLLAQSKAAASDPEKLIFIQELVENGLFEVPNIYIRPPHDRPCAAEVSDEIPVINLAELFGDGRPRVVEEIGRASEEWGFFQVINHGVQPITIERLRAAARVFFQKPPEERMRLHSKDFSSPVGYATSFNPSVEKVREWRDVVRFNSVIPGDADGFQEAPKFCRQQLVKSVSGVENLADSLYRAVFESLGVKEEDMEASGVPPLRRFQMGINYYPPCPDPSLTLGVCEHSDLNCLTILHPDETPGLQVKKGGKWVSLKPTPNAFVIILGDQTEITTNGKYRSIEHRGVTNTDKIRMSIACFFGPTEDAIIAPLPKLIDESHQPIYKPTMYGDYVKNFVTISDLSGRGSLNFARI